MNKLVTRLENLLHRCVGNFLHREEGNIESSLVLIPLMVLFLIAIELIVATNLRNTDAALAQGDASHRAISGSLRGSDQVIELDSPDPFSKVRVLISQRRHTLPQLVPGLVALLGGDAVMVVHGAAVMEDSN